MTWDINNFTTLSRYMEGGSVTFGDDSKGTIIGIGNIQIGASPTIENVVLVDGLKHNLLSISQFCDVDLRLFLMILLAKSLMLKPMIVFSPVFVMKMFISLTCLIWIVLLNA